MPDLHEIKLVIRCRDFEASLSFYRDLLGLEVTEEWEEPSGKGAILSPSGRRSSGSIEVYEMTEHDDRYDPAFSLPFSNDKADIQIRTSELDRWVETLQGNWPITGPENTAWGHRWIKLRDPDNFLVAIYQETAE